MRTIALFLILLPFGAPAQVPATDIRNTRDAGTNTHFDIPHFATKAEWEKRRAELRSQILMSAGLDILPDRTPLTPRIFGKLDRGDYSIEKVLIQTMPGYWLGGNLYRPLGKQGKFPGIVSPHGHWKKGRLENTETGSIPARGISLARQGFVVFTYDMVGYNDTKQTSHDFAGPAEQLWAFGPLGLQLWNSIRALDFVQALPDVDSTRLAATGASGGATQTFLLSAVDDRVKFSSPVNMISAIMQGGSPCENAPGLRVGAINVEIGAMMAPRPMLMVAATGDWTKNTPREEYPAIRGIYKLYDAEPNLEMIQITAPHNYNKDSREAVYQFFGKKILALHDTANLKEGEIREEKDGDMLALAGLDLPAGALNYDRIFEQWKQMARRQAGGTWDASLIRRRLALAIGTEWPTAVESARNGEKIVLSRKGVGDRVEGVWLDGQGQPAVVIHSGGNEAARNSEQVKALIAAHRPVLLIEPFHTTWDTSVKHYLTFHRSEDANRTQDIVTAIAYFGKDKVELIGLEKAAVWTTFAAAVAERPVDLRANLANFRGSDQDYIDNYFVPGIQRVGGIMAVRRAMQMANVKVLRDVEYARPQGIPQLLDLYIPESKTPLPVLIAVHGGGWRAGSKAGSGSIRESLRGYAVASIDYRLSDVAIFPAQIDDCLAAVRWLRANASKYNLDPKRFAAKGESAGGHLVALMGTLGNQNPETRIQAVIDFYGPTDLTKMAEQQKASPGVKFQINHDSPNSPEALLIGGPLQQNKAKAARANPINYIDKNTAPFLIMHGDRDPLVPTEQSRILLNALEKAGIPASLHIVKSGGHGFGGPEIDAKVDEFFDRMLKNKPL